MAQTTEPKVTSIFVRVEQSLVDRADAVANRVYAGNRSYLIRQAITEHIDRKEAELAERDANELQAA